ncbi:ATP-binding protein [Thiorhodococcus mannitoliphagus]|uniref:ATP-binding protein n=1 Tax=Thiorhodococcus mannitoliphagus TaxID=329406 RepID=A0A6P1DSI9_9GAMM|nr:ATP-binding protein [Thiorhodococcus mannitoliphagus]NEX18972.1 ATP-binding protein [Thiorhodococcus mannitoliphagus]
MNRKRLPIGIQTFSEIREGGYYYVDKTPFALRLIEQGKYYFLSRPRRFGKSLFLDTLAELFSANAPLFDGLHAQTRWDWTRPYPVVRLSFAEGVMASRVQLDRRIEDLLRINSQALGVAIHPGLDIAGSFGDLLRNVHADTGERVVVLVDEYDKPILDNLTETDTARQLRDGLRNLYSVIKGADAHIRFAFLTGVSKFSKVSLFSGLNNLRDITVSSEYSAICGYTEADLDAVFAPELDGLDREQIRAWYNGYNWTGEAVYNPFDVLLLFQERQFRPWWFETATPTFLIDLLVQRQVFLPRLGQRFASEALLSTFDVERIGTEALLFQTGYLTIDSVRQLGALIEYQLRYPNLEVQASLTGALLEQIVPLPEQPALRPSRLYELLLENDFTGIEQLFRAFFASIPHDWYRNNPIAQYEGYYASVFYAYFASLGLDLTPEDSSNAGRLDMALRFNGNVYLFEFKVVELASEGRALQQIKNQGYADKYRAEGRPIHLIGVEFSRERRTMVGFEVESAL